MPRGISEPHWFGNVLRKGGETLAAYRGSPAAHIDDCSDFCSSDFHGKKTFVSEQVTTFDRLLGEGCPELTDLRLTDIAIRVRACCGPTAACHILFV